MAGESAGGVAPGVSTGGVVSGGGSVGEETLAGSEGGVAEGRGAGGVGRGVADWVEEGEEGEDVATGNEETVGVGEAVRFKTMAEAAVTGGAGGVGVGVGVGEGVAAPGRGDGRGCPVLEVTCTPSQQRGSKEACEIMVGRQVLREISRTKNGRQVR